MPTQCFAAYAHGTGNHLVAISNIMQSMDRALWRIHGLIQSQDSGEKDQSSATNEHKNEVTAEGSSSMMSGTQMDKRRTTTRTKAKSTQPQKKVVDERPEGWLWHLGRLSKMSDTEMDEWSNEGEALTFRVQNVTGFNGFEPKQKCKRWQEQGEQKLAELLRTNRSFLKMEDTWTALASQNAQTKPGHSAYAKHRH
ncbi:hypothetical protein B0H14DRAFT_2566624 [Mycena olivaceomarginata]|nr:hypothetical protein B0H14DRAFT_2566624 [Mycena olivaceomarginata]